MHRNDMFQPLLASDPAVATPGRFRLAASSVWNFTKKVARAVFTPVLGAGLLALASSTYTAINSGMAPSGMSPSQLGAVWLESMTADVVFWSFTFAGAALVINTMMNTKFYSEIIPRLKKGFQEAKKSLSKATIYTICFAFAVGSGLSIGAISYESTSFFKGGLIAIQVSIALLTFASIVSGRTLSLAALTDDISRRRDPDGRILLKFGKRLQQIHPAKRRQVEQAVKNILDTIIPQNAAQRTMNADQFRLLLRSLAKQLISLDTDPNLPLIVARTKGVTFFDGTLFGCKMILAVGSGAIAAVVFDQKQWDGINIIAQHITGSPIAGVPGYAKALAGIPGGAASAVFYGKSAYSSLDCIIDLAVYCMQKPVMIPVVLGILFCVGASGAGSTTIVNGIANNPNNTFGFVPETEITMAATFMLVIGAIFANLAGATAWYLGNPESDLVTLRYVVRRVMGLSDRLDDETQTEISTFLNHGASSVREFSIFPEVVVESPQVELLDNEDEKEKTDVQGQHRRVPTLSRRIEDID